MKTVFAKSVHSMTVDLMKLSSIILLRLSSIKPRVVQIFRKTLNSLLMEITQLLLNKSNKRMDSSITFQFRNQSLQMVMKTKLKMIIMMTMMIKRQKNRKITLVLEIESKNVKKALRAVEMKVMKTITTIIMIMIIAMMIASIQSTLKKRKRTKINLKKIKKEMIRRRMIKRITKMCHRKSVKILSSVYIK